MREITMEEVSKLGDVAREISSSERGGVLEIN